ncbi:hypothetical protein GCM10017567_12120 [Amycolatopsis bullii]|uniref:Uncharacterized protein n=1 Tax=Amycolatopsis bullii TaxID=941987 RepID=A0ABQ3K1F7_9PSEU|nr:hypothetical protein GCM10017567_12120 [Amycolatopsis bullii]
MSPRTTEPTDGRCDHAVPRLDADLADKLARIGTCELIGAISYTFDGSGEERYGVRSTKWNTFNSADRTAGELPLRLLSFTRS